jgi:GNAT superfamily N-acetyltransferase
MDEPIRIRRGTAEDIPVILRHRMAMMAEMGMGNPEANDAYAGLFPPFARRMMTEGFYHQWMVDTESGETVAGGAVYIVPWLGGPHDLRQQRVFIVNVFTEPAYRRRGIARRLMETMLAWCRDQGYRQVRLYASDMGRPLYAAMGFEPTHEMRYLFAP